MGLPCKWTNDSQHFLLEHYDTICDSPPQIYKYALPFCPTSSWLRNYYSTELSQAVRVVKGASAEWGTCSRTVSLSGIPQVISYGNNTTAVGLRDGNIIILDAITGSQGAVLSGHTDWVRSLVFSSDERLLVSGSDDDTVKIWDVQTGGIIKTLYGHSDYVLSVSISADCTKIASGSDDGKICLWNIQNGENYKNITLQDPVKYVSFFPTDTGHLMALSGKKVQQLDIDGYQTGPTYNASHTTFSLNHTQFVLCNENAVTVHNSDSGVLAAELHLTDECHAQYCCFSPDDSLVAVASERVAYVWNISNSVPHLVATFSGHSDYITSLVFSSPSSLISASEDSSVKFWQIGISSTDKVSTDPISTLTTSVPIQFVSLQTKEGIAISGDSNGVVKIWDILTGLCKTSFQTSARKSFWGDAQLIDGRLLLIWGLKDVHIWESEKGELSQTLGSAGSGGLRISGDGSKVFNVYWNDSASRIQVWSIQTWELVDEVDLETGKFYKISPFCADGSKLWVQDRNLIFKGWDFKVSASSLIPLSNSSSERPYLDFINDTTQESKPSFVKNTMTGEEAFRLAGKYEKPHIGNARWDGQYLVLGYDDGEVLILDFKNLCSQ